MTDDKNRDLDDLIRAASQRDVDDGAIFRSVLDQIDQEGNWHSWFRLPVLNPGPAAAGFAAMMFIAGVAGYVLPDLTLGPAEEEFLVLAMGDDTLTSGLLGVSE